MLPGQFRQSQQSVPSEQNGELSHIPSFANPQVLLLPVNTPVVGSEVICTFVVGPAVLVVVHAEFSCSRVNMPSVAD